MISPVVDPGWSGQDASPVANTFDSPHPSSATPASKAVATPSQTASPSPDPKKIARDHYARKYKEKKKQEEAEKIRRENPTPSSKAKKSRPKKASDGLLDHDSYLFDDPPEIPEYLSDPSMKGLGFLLDKAMEKKLSRNPTMKKWPYEYQKEHRVEREGKHYFFEPLVIAHLHPLTSILVTSTRFRSRIYFHLFWSSNALPPVFVPGRTSTCFGPRTHFHSFSSSDPLPLVFDAGLTSICFRLWIYFHLFLSPIVLPPVFAFQLTSLYFRHATYFHLFLSSGLLPPIFVAGSTSFYL